MHQYSQQPRSSFGHRSQGLCLFSVSRWTCCVTTGKAELVGAGHQLLDQSAFSDTGWSTYDQRTRKGLRRLYHSGGGCRFRRRGCLRAFCSSHADPGFAPRLPGAYRKLYKSRPVKLYVSRENCVMMLREIAHSGKRAPFSTGRWQMEEEVGNDLQQSQTQVLVCRLQHPEDKRPQAFLQRTKVPPCR